MVIKFLLDICKKVWKCFLKFFIGGNYLMYLNFMFSVGNVFFYLKLIDEEIVLEVFICKKVCIVFDFWKKDYK